MVETGGGARARRVMVAAGAGREAVKLAPVVRALRARPGIKVQLVAGGPSAEALAAVLALFALKPDIIAAAGDATALAAAIAASRPELVLVQGRSRTAVAMARAAAAAAVPVAHVEAGLPSDDPRDGVAQEIGALAQLHFAPTAGARDALLARGIAPGRVHVTGSSAIDALHMAVERLDADSALAARSGLAPDGEGPLVLVVAQRSDTPFAAVAAVVQTLLHETSARFLFAIDPAAREQLAARFAGSPRVRVTGRLQFLEFVAALRAAHLVLTDSSSVEEMAPALGLPVLVMRSATNRPEGVSAGCAALVGTGATAIAAAAMRLLAHPSAHAAMANVRSPYGDGLAAWRMAAAVRNWFADGLFGNGA